MQLSPALLGLATLTLVFAQFPQPAPAPLPPVTPSDVVNILIQALSDSPGDVVASVVAANDTATVYALECAIEPTRSANPSELRCLVGRARWSNGVTITQGPSSMIWSYSGPENSGVNQATEACTFNGTTAKTAICTNSLGFGTYFTQDNPYHTLTYDGQLDKNGQIDQQAGIFGPPPFLPVKITAGMEKISAVGVTSTTSAPSVTSTSGSSVTPPAVLPSACSTCGAAVPTTSTTTSAAVGRAGSWSLIMMTLFVGLAWSC